MTQINHLEQMISQHKKMANSYLKEAQKHKQIVYRCETELKNIKKWQSTQ